MGGLSAAKLPGLRQQPPAGRRIFVRRAEGGSCLAANGVPKVNRLYADYADDEPLLGQLCLIWQKYGYLCIMYAYYLYTVQSRKLQPNFLVSVEVSHIRSAL